MLDMKESWDVVRDCALCGSIAENHINFETIIDRGITLEYSMCTDCGLIFQSPRMDQASLNRFYLDQYRKIVQDSEGPTDKDLCVQAGRSRALLQFVRGEVGTIRRHLDIGCSAGSLLLRFHATFDCESVGIEPGDAYRQYTSKHDLHVYRDLESLESQGESPFDLVSMSHVLEHLPNPLEYLNHLRERWITPEGWILIEVPNLFGHQSFELAHLYAYTSTTLKAMLNQTGFEVKRIRSHGRPRSLLIPLYLTALARVRPSGSPPRRIRSSSSTVRLRRRLGIGWRCMATRFLSRWAWLPWPEIEDVAE
jgi:SAM-dependent methyltransferase